MHKWLTLAAALALGHSAHALDADDYRGGWTTDPHDEVPHVFDFSIRGDRVRGISCTHCSDATTLAFVDGEFGEDGLTFAVTHVEPDGSTAYIDHAKARIEDGRLLVSGMSGAPGGGAFEWALHKDPRGPAPSPIPVTRLPPLPGAAVPEVQRPRAAGGPPGGGPAPRRYVPPGPWEALTPAKVAGVWLGYGAGIDKQFFIIRRFGRGLRGMVCGRCDNPYTMAVLDDFEIEGDTLKFNILHEDWGFGALPYHNQVTAHVTNNEMRISTYQDNMPAGQGPHSEASLMGPIAIEATVGNR